MLEPAQDNDDQMTPAKHRELLNESDEAPAIVYRWTPISQTDDFASALTALLAATCTEGVGVVIQIPANCVVNLGASVITLNARGSLTIVGGEGSRVCGSGYCVFHVRGRKTRLVLSNLSLHHTCVRADKREIGACVFSLASSSVTLHACALQSENGFALWAVQYSKLNLRSCSVRACRRSGLVAFGDADIAALHCSFVGNSIHGVCARGRVRLRVEDCSFESNGVRALYAYQASGLVMKGCSVLGTRDPNQSAVSVQCQGASQTISITGCRFSDNAGAALTIGGAALCSVDVSGCINVRADGVEEPLEPIFGPDNLLEEGKEEEMGEGGSKTWHYNVDDTDAGWRKYPNESTAKIEEAFLHFLESPSHSSLSLDLEHSSYSLCFESMTQTNVYTHFSRAIRRGT